MESYRGYECMIKLFKGYFIISIMAAVLMIAGGVLGLLDIIPFWAEIVLIIVLYGVVLLMSVLSVKKYTKICDIANTDPDKFVEMSDEMAKKSAGVRRMVLGNAIVSLLNHERVDEAERRTAEYGKDLKPNDIVGRFMYSNYMCCIDILKRDFSRMDLYINDQRMCLQQMSVNRPRGINDLTLQRFHAAVEKEAFEAEFYSRPPERLMNEDRQIVLNYIANADILRGFSRKGAVMYECTEKLLDYDKGMAYAVIGEREKAAQFLTSAAECGFTYPFVERAKKWLQSGDVNVLMRNGRAAEVEK